MPRGTTLLLSETEVEELVRYLLEPQTVLWSENPSPTEPGDYAALFFFQPGMVGVLKSGRVVNGEGHWSPAFFKRLRPVDPKKGITPKIHTLPWKLPRQSRKRVARA